MWGIFSEGHGSGLRLVARDGAQVPGEEHEVFFDGMGNVQLNNEGQVVFRSGLHGADSTTRDYRIFVDDPEAAVGIIAKSGEQAPGAAPGVQFGFFNGLALNDLGHVAFHSNLVDSATTAISGQGIFRHNNGGIEPVAISGQDLPGAPDTKFGNAFDKPAMNDLGQTAFTGSLAVPDVEFHPAAFFSEGGGEGIRLVARSGMPAPGTEAGVSFDYFRSKYAINNLGQTVFTSTLNGPGIDEANGFAIFVEAIDSGSQLIARTGDQLDVSDDPAVSDLRTIRELGDGYWFDLNDAGEVAFFAEFTDGSYGVFVAQPVPEPAAEFPMLFGLLLVLLKLRGQRMRPSAG